MMSIILPISAFPDLVNAFVCLIGFALLHSSRKVATEGHHQKQLKWFEQTYLFLTIAYFFFAIPVFFLMDFPVWLGMTFTIAHLFLFVALSSFVRIPVSFYFPKQTQTIFMVYIIAAIIMTIWSLAHLPQPTYLPLPGVIDWNQDASAAIPTAILFFTVLSPSLIFFFYQSIVVKDFPIRARAFLFSLGIALLISSAVFFYLLDFSWKFMIVNFLAMLGYLVFLVGIIIGRQREL